MPRLRILVSTPNQAYPPKQPLGVNSPSPTEIKTPGFEGEMSVWIKDFQGDDKKGEGDEYFGREGRGGMTYAIVIRGMCICLLTWLVEGSRESESRGHTVREESGSRWRPRCTVFELEYGTTCLAVCTPDALSLPPPARATAKADAHIQVASSPRSMPTTSYLATCSRNL